VYQVVLADPPSFYVQAQLQGQVDMRMVAPDHSDLAPLLRTADALFVRLFPVTADLLSGAPRLKVIGRHGVGYDTVDVPAATARGIPVIYAPNANSDSVAEHCVLLMLAVARRLVYADRAVRLAEWTRGRDWNLPLSVGMELREKTLGIVGVGQVGRRVAQIAGAGLGMTVLGHDPFLSPPAFPAGVERLDALAPLLRRADIVTLHVPLSAGTRRLINADRLAQMKPGAILINTARGGLVDEAALEAALQSGRLAGAGLDVLEEEPPPARHPLLTWDPRRVTLTPHVAGISERSLQRMAEMVCRGILAVLRGERPANVVNPEVWSASPSE
jgi:D-3-phosphoglycerate dehydrogenase